MQTAEYILALFLKESCYTWFYYIYEIPGAHLTKVPTSIFSLHGMLSSDVPKCLPHCWSLQSVTILILPSLIYEKRGRLIFTQPHFPFLLGRDWAQDEDHACDSVYNAGWLFKLSLQSEETQPVQAPGAQWTSWPPAKACFRQAEALFWLHWLSTGSPWLSLVA